MRFDITSYRGTDLIKFGMTQQEIRDKIKSPVRDFKRNSFQENLADVFPEVHVFVYYDESNRANAFEFSSPADVFYKDIDLLGLSYGDVVAGLSKEDDAIEFDGDGFTSTKLGFGVYAPEGVYDPSVQAKAVIVFVRNYYSEITD